MNGVAEVSAKYLAEASSNTVPVGYKQTEAGLIPEDWELTQLSNLCERISVGLATSVTKYYRSKGVPIVRNMNIKDGYFDGTDMLYLAPEFAKANISKAANALDVITVHTGSNIGLTCVLPESFDKCQTFTTLITTTKKMVLNPFYLSLHMASQDGKNEIARLQVGGGKGNLNTGELKQYLISYPKSIEEQTAIANALSDVDALICELEKLIAKKQAIKTATMQQLLTGRTRLPQFALREDGTPKGTKLSDLGEIPEDWEVVKIGELGQVDPENLGATTSPDYEFNYVSLEQIEKGVLVGTTRTIFRNAPSRARRVLKKGDILVSTVRPNLMSHYFIQHEVNDLICSTGFSVIRFFEEKLCPGYLYQHLFSSVINNQIEMLISGSNYPAINSGDVKQLKVQIGSIEEQTAIATILSDMDEEIQALEQRLSKTRQIKQGMMQELLTGKTRLPVDQQNIVQGSEA